MNSHSPLIRYHLPTTVVKIQGAVTTKKEYMKNVLSDEINDRRIVTRINVDDLVFDTIADPDLYYCIDLEKTKLSDDTFALELSDDGRIISTNSTSTGKMGTVVKNMAGFITNVAAIASAFISPAAAIPHIFKSDEIEIDLEDLYEKNHLDLATRRKKIREAIDTLTDRLIDLQIAIANESNEQQRKISIESASQVKNSLDNLRALSESVESIFVAWKNSMEDEEEHKYSFALDMKDILESSLVKDRDKDGFEKLLKDKSSRFEPVYRSLDFILTKSNLSRNKEEDDAPDYVAPILAGNSFSGIFCRRPRLVEFTVWKIDAANKISPIAKTIHSIVDGDSALFKIEFGKTSWSNYNTKVELHASNGSLKTISTSSTSALVSASESLNQLPKEIFSSLETANKIGSLPLSMLIDGSTHSWHGFDGKNQLSIDF